MLYIKVILLFVFLIQLTEQICIKEKIIKNEKTIQLEPQLGCIIRIYLSPGLSVQVTCQSVSENFQEPSCSDQLLTINVSNQELPDKFCILGRYSENELQVSIDRLYINPDYIDFKVENIKRSTLSLSTCSITTRYLAKKPQSSLRSLFEGNFVGTWNWEKGRFYRNKSYNFSYYF